MFRNSKIAILCVALLLGRDLFFSKAYAGNSEAMAAAAQGAASVATTVAIIDTMGSGLDCTCEGSGCTGTPWMKCAVIGLNIAAMVLGIAAAMQSGSAKDAVHGQEGSLMPSADAGSGSGDFGSGIDGMGGQSLGLGSNASNSANPLLDYSGWDQNALKDACAQNPQGFICQKDPVAALDQVKNDFLQAMDSGKFDGPGEKGLPEGETVEGTLANFDKAKSQLQAMLANTTNFGKKGGKGTSGTDSAGVTAVAGGNISALKGLSKDAVNFGGGRPGKSIIENGLEIIDENTGKSLTLWQRATNRHMGSGGERGYMLARMEGLRRDALRYMAKKDSSVAPVAMSKSQSPQAAVDNNRAPASAPTENPAAHDGAASAKP